MFYLLGRRWDKARPKVHNNLAVRVCIAYWLDICRDHNEAVLRLSSQMEVGQQARLSF
jgi:hypothetical protein